MAARVVPAVAVAHKSRVTAVAGARKFRVTTITSDIGGKRSSTRTQPGDQNRSQLLDDAPAARAAAAGATPGGGGGKHGKHPPRTERRPIPRPLVDSLWNPVNLWQYSTFSWAGGMLADGYARSLDENDLFELPPYMRSRFLTDRLEVKFQQYHKEGYKHPLAWAMIYANLR